MTCADGRRRSSAPGTQHSAEGSERQVRERRQPQAAVWFFLRAQTGLDDSRQPRKKAAIRSQPCGGTPQEPSKRKGPPSQSPPHEARSRGGSGSKAVKKEAIIEEMPAHTTRPTLIQMKGAQDRTKAVELQNVVSNNYDPGKELAAAVRRMEGYQEMAWICRLARR